MACKVGRLVNKSSALFLCDMQEKFSQNIKYFNEIVEVSSRLLRAAKLLDMPVIVTEQYPKGLGHTVAQLGVQDYPEIRPIAKTQFSMMTPEVVAMMSKEYAHVQSVVLCGIEAHVCVQGTCLALLEAGFEVHVVADGCSSRATVDRMFSFDRMKASGAWITTSESVILSLLSDAAHPKFKECQKIIMDSAPDTGLMAYFGIGK